jgi:hypothetical protein
VLLGFLTVAMPVQAAVGMPEIGSVQVGTYRARLLNDSAGLRQGTNTLTVHIPDLPAGQGVTLRLHGPGGELIDVPLRPLRVLPGPRGRHASAVVTAAVTPAHASNAGETDIGSVDRARPHDGPAHREATGGGHAHHAPAHLENGQNGPGPDAHGEKPGGAHVGDDQAAPRGGHDAGAHGGDVFEGYAVRGVVRLPATGPWRAVLTAGDGHGAPLTGELTLDVGTDGPNPLYLGFLGLLTGGSVLYGWTRRRLAESRQ